MLVTTGSVISQDTLDDQAICKDVLLEKYAAKGETGSLDIRQRVAVALADVEKSHKDKWADKFLWAQLNGFVPAGRINAAAGVESDATLVNCFVQPVGDAISGVAGEKPGIYTALIEATETMRRGGGVGYDFSEIRPKGAWVGSTHSIASGPVAYMRVYDKACESVESSGSRRSAQMGILRCDHPDIEDFIHAKDKGELSNFNISIAVTDVFMQAVEGTLFIELSHKAEPSDDLKKAGAYLRPDGMWVYRKVNARELWSQIMRSTYNHAEPGILFIDTINRDNNLWYCETIASTNPCVSGRTRLHTQYGMVRMDDLFATQVEVMATVDPRIRRTEGGGAAIKPASTAFMTSGDAELFEVTTKYGYQIEATAWHRFHVSNPDVPLAKRHLNNLVPLSKMGVGDRVWIQSGRGQFGPQGSSDLGVVLGLMTGQGHFIHKPGASTVAVIGLWGATPELVESVVERIKNVVDQSIDAVADIDVEEDEERNLTLIRSEKLARSLKTFDFTTETQDKVPEVVWKGTRECVSGYLSALFSSEGHYQLMDDRQYPTIRLATMESQLLKDVQILLANFGIMSRRHYRKQGITLLVADENGDTHDYRTDANYELCVSKNALRTFVKDVGLLFNHDVEAFKEWMARDTKTAQNQMYASGFEDEVVSIKSIGYAPVYDVTQPDGSSIVLNGLATGNCAEQPLPAYGSCCLGSLNLVSFVRNAFVMSPAPSFDFDKFKDVIRLAVRMLDNVLTLTKWPLPQQGREAAMKRRIGLGVTGLGNALVMLGLRYDKAEGREMAERIFECLRDTSYLSSVELAKERGAFPLFDEKRYLSKSSFASRLPAEIKKEIREHGIRNSHLLSVAPTGTISMAFCGNASNGIEPAFSYQYERKKRMPDDTKKTYEVEDFAWRYYKKMGGDLNKLPDSFVTALDMPAEAHRAMVEVVAKYCDAAVSKTVNIPEDYPYADFENLYLNAWKSGIKGLTTYRPNSVVGSVLTVSQEKKSDSPPLPTPETIQLPEADRRLALNGVPTPVLDSLRYPVRPELEEGALAWVSPTMRHPAGAFCVTVAELNGHPFEVRVSGVDGETPPRGLEDVANILTLDMHTGDKAWLQMKLKTLNKVNGDEFSGRLPGRESAALLSSAVAALSLIIHSRTGLTSLKPKKNEATPFVSALLSPREPKTTLSGTLGWVVDVENPVTQDTFVLMTKELMMPDGQTRPYSMWLAGNYPKSLDGVAKLLSLDMRIVDPAWIGMKLRTLTLSQEPRGNFMGKCPTTGKNYHYPSTVAYIAKLLIHRYAMLNILTPEGYPIKPLGVLSGQKGDSESEVSHKKVIPGTLCMECNVFAVVKLGGCSTCTNCGHTGSCG